MERAAHIESGGGLAYRPNFASFGARALTLIVDLIATIVFLAPGIFMFTRFGAVGKVLGVLIALIGFGFAARSYARGVASTGTWVGNRVTDTKVLDARNGELITSASAATRFVLRFTVSLILFLGYIPALRDGQRRTFHDKFAGSIVTRRPRQEWTLGDS